MAETLVQFQAPVASSDGVVYQARACGAETTAGLWEGWIEFTPAHGGKPVHSARETTQPNRRDVEYWATGLTPIFLEGALRRALAGPVTVVHVRRQRPAFNAPARSVSHSTVERVAGTESALDPFSVYAKGEALLRKQLGALSAWHLVNIVVDYGLSDEPDEALNRLPASSLVEVIVSGVRERRQVLDR